jgi:aspartyl protease family protein
MESFEIGQFAYLVLLFVAVGGWAVTELRRNWGRSIRQLAAWGFIFIGIIAAYGLWTDIRNDLNPRQSLVQSGVVEVPRAPDGHYQLVVRLNDVPVNFLVDTGASDIVLTKQDAERIGIDLSDLDFLGRATTANGNVQTAAISIDTVQLEDIIDRNVRASVNNGEMPDSLLGMSYLSRFEKLEISGNTLVLTR